MTYKGKYKVKNTEKYHGDHTNVVYICLWERQAFRWCDENAKIKSWSSEEIIIPYLYEVDKKYHRYFMDLKITLDSGQTYLIEIKPEKELSPPTGSRKTKRYITEGLTFVKNQNKWKAASEYAKDRGWHFQIWTEKELRSLGILPKAYDKLKPYTQPLSRKNK